VLHFTSACGVDCRRKKRDTSRGQSRTDEDLLPADAIVPLEAVEVPGPEGLHPNDTWPTASGITLDAATSSCRSPILSLSIFSICDNYTSTTRPAIINSCVLDIQVRWWILTVDDDALCNHKDDCHESGRSGTVRIMVLTKLLLTRSRHL